jgi:hypothetical protein
MPVVGSAERSNKMPTGSFQKGKYEVRTFWRVIVDSDDDSCVTVVNATGLPLLDSTYEWGNESNEEMYAEEYITTSLGAKTKAWEVTVVYRTPALKDDSSEDAGGGAGRRTPGEFLNPLLELPTAKVHFSGRETLLTQIVDVNGNLGPVAASNGEVFDPPPKYMQTIMTLTIERNEVIDADHPAIGAAYTNRLNSDYFWGIAPGFWKIKEITAEPKSRQIPGGDTNRYLRVSYVFEYNPDGWPIELLDYGTYTWEQRPGPVAANPQLVKTAIKINGKEAAAPLNGKGRVLQDRLSFTVLSGSSALTIPASTGNISYAVGDVVQVVSPTGVLPSPLGRDTNYYVVDVLDSADPTQLTTFGLSLTEGGAAVEYLDSGTGSFYIWSPGVFSTVNPYESVAYANLLLPANFMACQ